MADVAFVVGSADSKLAAATFETLVIIALGFKQISYAILSDHEYNTHCLRSEVRIAEGVELAADTLPHLLNLLMLLLQLSVAILTSDAPRLGYGVLVFVDFGE